MATVVPVRRRLCSELVTVSWADNHSRPQGVKGNLEEISECSAVILCDESIPRGTVVHINCEDHWLIGIVESCTFESLLGCFVAVRLDPQSRWSEEWFTPKHLLGLGRPLQSHGVFHVGTPSGY
jgi:hypothetical protein